MNRIVHYISITIVLLTLFTSCKDGHSGAVVYAPNQRIDSLLYYGANCYDVASLLYKNPDYLDVQMDSSSTSSYDVVTSSDGNFRVYSIFDSSSSTYDVHNIFHYRNGDDVHVKADAGDWGYITGIGTIRSGEKNYYILVSEYVALHQGLHYTAMVSVYSLNEYIYDSLTRESVFIPKSGRPIDSITVSWNDNGGDKDSLNLFGISMDSNNNTKEIYIQVIDAQNGDATDNALVYRWNGTQFVFSEIRHMRIERKEPLL